MVADIFTPTSALAIKKTSYGPGNKRKIAVKPTIKPNLAVSKVLLGKF